MKHNFHADIVIKINSFEADNHEIADEIVDKYINVLASVGGDLYWDSVDYTIIQEEE